MSLDIFWLKDDHLENIGNLPHRMELRMRLCKIFKPLSNNTNAWQTQWRNETIQNYR